MRLALQTGNDENDGFMGQGCSPSGMVATVQCKARLLLADIIAALLLIDLPLSYIASLDLIYEIAAASDCDDT